MAPDKFSPQSACPACGASAARDASYCVGCGQPLRRLAPMNAPMRVVEAEAPALSELSDWPAGGALSIEAATTERPPALPERLGERVVTLASAAWRQPAVRSVVTTGASAVALSLIWRVAGAALRGGRARRLLVSQMADESLAPMVGELLRGATPARRLRRRGRRGEIVEEMIYVRRVFRR
jgi:hypothetical protein